MKLNFVFLICIFGLVDCCIRKEYSTTISLIDFLDIGEFISEAVDTTETKIEIETQVTCNKSLSHVKEYIHCYNLGNFQSSSSYPRNLILKFFEFYRKMQGKNYVFK